jgi:Fe-S-cluster containining protein
MSDPVAVAQINFRFECQPGCVNCCARPGEVYLTEEDRDRIAAHLTLPVDEFTERYCAPDEDGGLRLSIPAAESCHFLNADGCSIHEVKPLQCQTFPFWPETVSSRKAWKGLRGYCPGVGVGEILSIDAIRKEAQKSADAFPE